jgi:hypothetical protein
MRPAPASAIVDPFSSRIVSTRPPGRLCFDDDDSVTSLLKFETAVRPLIPAPRTRMRLGCRFGSGVGKEVMFY